MGELKIPTMLTIKEAVSQFHGISEYHLRLLVKRQDCPFRYIKTGTKTLINADSLVAYLNGTEGNDG
jgi:hypothetical protein